MSIMGKKFGLPFSWKRTLGCGLAGRVPALPLLGLGAGAAAALCLPRF
jgi:hypothetical protein